MTISRAQLSRVAIVGIFLLPRVTPRASFPRLLNTLMSSMVHQPVATPFYGGYTTNLLAASILDEDEIDARHGVAALERSHRSLLQASMRRGVQVVGAQPPPATSSQTKLSSVAASQVTPTAKPKLSKDTVVMASGGFGSSTLATAVATATAAAVASVFSSDVDSCAASSITLDDDLGEAAGDRQLLLDIITAQATSAATGHHGTADLELLDDSTTSVLAALISARNRDVRDLEALEARESSQLTLLETELSAAIKKRVGVAKDVKATEERLTECLQAQRDDKRKLAERKAQVAVDRAGFQRRVEQQQREINLLKRKIEESKEQFSEQQLTSDRADIVSSPRTTASGAAVDSSTRSSPRVPSSSVATVVTSKKTANEATEALRVTKTQKAVGGASSCVVGVKSGSKSAREADVGKPSGVRKSALTAASKSSNDSKNRPKNVVASTTPSKVVRRGA